MSSWIGGSRFKVEEVNNGWIVEFHPRKTDADHAPKTQKHIAQHNEGHFLLLDVIKTLLEEQDQQDQEDPPKSSEH